MPKSPRGTDQRSRVRPSRNAWCVVLVTVAGAAFAACGSGTPPRTSASASTPASTPTSLVTAVSNDKISPSTRLICSADAQHDIGVSLGITTTKPPIAQWVDHEYSCDYTYANGSMRLSVKQFTNRAATDFYFTALATKLVRRQTLEGLGQGAFTTLNNSVVVSKDNKVLVVDVRNLPAHFGVPADTRANVGISVAATIMGCWTGA